MTLDIRLLSIDTTFKYYSYMKMLASALISVSITIGLVVTTPANASVTKLLIAFQGPLTGPEAYIGMAQLNGVKFALWHFNKAFKGKFEVSLAEFDDQGHPQFSASLAPKLASNKRIIGLVGPSYSGATRSALPYYKQSLLPMISPSASSPSITDPAAEGGPAGFPVFHRMVAIAGTEGPALLKYATRDVHNPKIFIISDTSEYGLKLSESLKSEIQRDRLAGQETLENSFSKWSSLALKIKTTAANVVIYAGWNNPQLFINLRAEGYSGILAAGQGINTFQENVQASLPKGVRITVGTLLLSEISPKLEVYFRQIIGRPSGWYSAESIDAANVLLFCISNGVANRQKMLECVKTFKGNSISGRTFSFDENGDINSNNFYGIEISSDSISLENPLKNSKLTIPEIIQAFPWYFAVKDKGRGNTSVQDSDRVTTIKCIKDFTVLGVTGIKPKCPIGFKNK